MNKFRKGFGDMRFSYFQMKPMLKLLPLGFIFNNRDYIKDVGKMNILFQPQRELLESLFMLNFKPTFENSRYVPMEGCYECIRVYNNTSGSRFI